MAALLDQLASAFASRYAIARELGRGGMATVYLADDLRHRRKVAIKVLHPELAHGLGPERFLREIEIAARLTHPNILPLFDSGDVVAGREPQEGVVGHRSQVVDNQDPKTYDLRPATRDVRPTTLLYYVMPYVDGESLRQRLAREKQLAVEEAVRIAGEVAGALAYAHERGVIHRDIKPENIMLVAGHAVVTDFGIARAIDAVGGERLTETGFVVGTPAYMSPEQAAGERDVDARGDIYALGCVLYELLAGEPPYTGPSAQAVIAKCMVDPVPRIRRVRDTVSPAIEQALTKALAKVPADRFASAAAFAEALTGAAATAATTTAPIQPTGEAGPTRQRLAVLPFADLLNDPAQEYFVLGMHDAVIVELAQAHVPVVARTSVMRYAASDAPVREIGRTLGVQLVLEGAVVRMGRTAQIRARLIDVESEEYLWLGDYELDLLGDALGSHRRISSAIARAVRETVQPGAAVSGPSAAVDDRAYEAYLRGRFHYFRFTPPDMAAALRCFEHALEHQPDYGAPYAGIANVRAAFGVMGVMPPSETMPQAKAAALRALQLDPKLSDAHHALACVLAWYDFDFAAADAEFAHAVKLNPSYGDAHAFHGHLLTLTGRVEAGAAALERALNLDPLNPFFGSLLAVHLMLIGRYDNAIATAQTALEASGDLMLAHMVVWGSCTRLGRHAEAVAAATAFFGLRQDHEVVRRLRADGADTYPTRMRAAADLLAARSQTSFVRPFLVAMLYDFAGDTDRACEWLDAAYRGRDHDCAYLGGCPFSEALRDDPQYADLLRRMRLPDLRRV